MRGTLVPEYIREGSIERSGDGERERLSFEKEKEEEERGE